MADKTGRVQYENRTRTCWGFDHPDYHDGTLVFGQSIDRDIPKEQRTTNTRSPVVVLTREQDAKFPEHARKMLDTLVKAGKIDRVELGA